MERTETQRKILEIGKKEFLEKGFKDASLNKIVAEAGFTKGAFYEIGRASCRERVLRLV